MHIDEAKWATCDREFTEYLTAHQNTPDRWMILQALLTSPTWKALFSMVNLENGWKVLDAGCGYGALTLALAGQLPLDITGVDENVRYLQTGEHIAGVLGSKGYFAEGSRVSFEAGDIYALVSEDKRYDFAIVRFVYQHLADPNRATASLAEVIKEGGYCMVIDIDDQMSITYPEPSEAYSKLHEAFAALQEVNGGDRYVGRKLSTYLSQGGFDIQMTLVLPQAQHVTMELNDSSRLFTLERLRASREEIIKAGLMSQDDFDTCMEVITLEQPGEQFRSNAQVVVLARKP